MALLEELKGKLINGIDTARELSDEDLKTAITELLMEKTNGRKFSVAEKMQIGNALFNSIRGLDVLQEIVDDDDVTEIMINGYENIFIEKRGKLYRYKGRFSSKEKLADIIQAVVAKANKRVNEADPIVDTRLPDGSRVNVVLNPVAINGPAVTIRKFPKRALTMDDLIAMGSITEEAAAFLKRLVVNGYNIFISGGTGSGKTTFLNVLSNFIPGDERIITIEDSAELRLDNIDNIVSLECRQENTEGENGITIRDLIRTSLRMRPDRIIVGECRGAEALDMLQAMNTGHDGSLSTGHANSTADMLTRLEMMVLMGGTEIPLAAVRSQIASAIDVMVHLGRMHDGSRKVLEISEIEGAFEGNIRLNRLFEYGTVKKGGPGKLRSTGNKMINTLKGGF